MFRKFFRLQSEASAPLAGLPMSIAEKVAFVLLLVIAPLGYSSWRVADAPTSALAATTEERMGLHYLHAVANAEAATARFLRSGDYEAMDDGAAALREAEHRYGGELGTSDLAEPVIVRLTGRSRADAIEAQALLGELVAKIRVEAHLDADAGVDIALFKGLALQSVPALRAELDALAAVAGSSGGGGLSNEEANDVLRRLGALEGALRPLDAITVAHANDAAFPLRDELSQARRSASFLTQELLAQARVRRLDSARWTPLLHTASSNASALERQARTAFDIRLGDRIDRLQEERFRAQLSGGLLILATLALALFALRQMVVKPIRQLVASTSSLLDGEYETDIAQRNRGDEVGEIARFLEMFRDMAQSRMRAEVARQTAESASLAKSQFIANMSHELRTPLNAIIGYSEIMLEDVEPASADGRDLERILSSARHLLTLINDILDVSKIEAGRMDLLVEDIEPRTLVLDVAETLRPSVEKNGSKLIIEVPGGTTQDFRTDPLKLRQCLMNLLSNAAKFTKDGQVRLRMERTLQSGAPALRFTVADTGIGMTRAQMNRLFQPFAQGDESITREFGGTGLGLVLTKHMAHLLGGDVSVASEQGKGSTFTLLITEQAEDTSASLLPTEHQSDGPLVVVIDDERDAQALVAATISPLGFSVVSAPNAASGLELVRSAQENGKAALVILDINLPDRPGWSILAALKNDAKTQDIPVLVCSVDADQRTSSSLGAAEHLVKPHTREVLAATVLRLARHRPTEPAPCDGVQDKDDAARSA